MKPLLQEAGAERALTGGARGAEPRLVGGGTGECSPPWRDAKGGLSPFEEITRREKDIEE